MDRRTLRVADLEVRLFGEAPRAGVPLEFHDLRAATAWLVTRMADARDAHVLRGLAGELDLGPAGDGRDVVARLAAALVAGRLTLIRPGAAPRPLELWALEHDDEADAREDDDAFVKLQEPPPTHWIEIELVDEDGEKLAGQRFVIVTPDGVKREGYTDSLGVGRVAQIAAGECKVCFPDLDPAAWEPL